MVMRVGAAAPSGASIGHVLSDRLAELRAATKNIGAHAKAGLDLANTDHQCRALLAVSTNFTQSQDFGAKNLIFFSKSDVLGPLGDTPHVYKIQKFS